MIVNNHIKTKFEKSIGNGTTGSYFLPFYWFYKYGYFAQIYSKQELGVGAPVWIKGIRLEQGRISDGQTIRTALNQNIKLGQVNSVEFGTGVRNDMTSLDANWSSSNIQPCKTNFSVYIPVSGQSFRDYMFDTPYRYDPTSTDEHLVLLWENRWGVYEDGSLNPRANGTPDGLYNVLYDYQDPSMPNSFDIGTRTNSSAWARTNIQLIFEV